MQELSPAEIAVDPRRYFESVSAVRGTAVRKPVCLYLETTNRCNLLCTTCPRTYEELEPPADMSWELFRSIAVPITKHNYLVRNVEEIPYVIKEAFYLARSGRPGPVLIDVTKDAQQARTVPRWDRPLRLPRHKGPCVLDRAAVERATALLVGAKRPLIMAGNGVIQSGASAELRALAERTGIPVITTLHGKGAFPESHELSLGMSGMHGWVHVNRAIQECDVLFNIGGRFDDRVTGKVSSFAPRAQIIHVDIDPSEIGKVVPTSIGIRGDARETLTCMLEPAPGARQLGVARAHPRDPEGARAAAGVPPPPGHAHAHAARRVRVARPRVPRAHRLSRGHRRGAAPDVGRAAHRVGASALAHHERRRGDDGLRDPGRARRRARVSERDDLGRSSATADSR